MEDNLLTTFIMPASLFIIMLGLGLALSLKDFRNVIEEPKAMALGLFNQLIILPVIGYGICVVFGLEIQLAIGLMLLVACPGGPTSNLISYVSRGDLALSISLTAVASIVTVFSIPLVMSWAVGMLGGDLVGLTLPLGKTILQLFIITLLPIIIGMSIHHKYPKWAQRMARPTKIFSIVFFILIIIGIVIANRHTLINQFSKIGGPTALLNLITMSLGYLLARSFGLSQPKQISIAIESGIQNGTLAIVIAATILGDINYGIPAAAYGLIMFVSGGFMMMVFGKLIPHYYKDKPSRI